MIPMFLFTLPAGHVADNYNRKRIVVLMTAVIAAASLGVAFISWRHAPVAWIYFCLFIGSTARTFMWAANAAFLPALVDRKDFPRAVNWNAGVFQLSCIVGRRWRRRIIAWMARHHSASPAALVYVINALASLVVCVLIGMVRRQHTVAAKEPMTLQALLTGFKFVYASKIILGLITLDMFAVFLGGATALLPIYAKDILFVGPTGLGFLAAALPLGSIALCVHPEPSAAIAKSRTHAAVGRDSLRTGDDCLRIFAVVLVFASHAVHMRGGGQYQCGGAAHAGADAHAGRKARARLRRQQPFHRHVERTGRVRVRHRGANLRADDRAHHCHRRGDFRRVRRHWDRF